LQHLQYLPFGEPWVSQTSNSYEGAKYTFSGKERDKETGLMYFGARYYNPEYGIWNQVDPLHAKYPYQSPFVYCANNPLRVIDPNGKDEWEFDNKGNINNVKKTEYDSFHKVDDDGNRTGESLSYDRKVVSGQFTIEGKQRSSSYLIVDDANDADDIFSFLSNSSEINGAEYTNSQVEDSQSNSFNLIGSDINAKKGESYSAPNLLNSGRFNVKSITHNHRWGKMSPSPDDVQLAKLFPNILFQIRTKGNICTPFDRTTPPDTDPVYEIPSVIVPGKR
jgi:RHS repeat-associated protein